MKLICKLLCSIAGVILFAMVIGVNAATLLRNLDLTEPAWIKDFTGYGMVWLSMLCMAVLAWKDEHLHLDSFGEYLSPKWNKITRLPIYALFAVVMGYLIPLTWTKANNEKYSVVNSLVVHDIELSMYWIYLALPIGCALMSLFSALRFGKTVIEIFKEEK
jgi:TRAP-type C4-dicarboxylate transport system permease small subunit